MLVSLDRASKSYGANLILEDVTANIGENDRIGLIGVNGAGKTTLLNLIHGDLEPDAGTVARSTAAGFLRQSGGLSFSGTIHSEMLRAFEPLTELEKELGALETRIAGSDPVSEEYPELTARYSKLQSLFEQRGGYDMELRIRTVLNGMGFGDVDPQTPVSVLSGGEKTRLALCKLLLEQPALLMLDEPTNHLDFQTLDWLETYLRGYKGALVVVSHDRYFLDKLCDSIWEVERKALERYPGNYSRYLRLKEERMERRRKEYEIQQVEITELKDFVARNLTRASTSARAKSKQKTLERMELSERPPPPPKPAKIRFTYRREPVKDVLHIRGLSLSAGEGAERKSLCANICLDIMRGEKLALIGANGVGKSTLLKAIQRLVPHDAGEIEWGRGVDVSYFEQEDFALHSEKTAIDELWDRFPREYEHTIRSVLAAVRLTGDNVYKKVGELSGGERAKLKFAMLSIKCGNMLLMDEPTNHLDLSTKEALDEALRDYTGTMLIVSHDRYLLDRVPTKIAELHPDGIRIYNGGYSSYLEQKNNTPIPSTPRETLPEKERPSAYLYGKKRRSEQAARKREAARLESEIERLEQLISRLENGITDPGIAADYLRLQDGCAQLEQARGELELRLAEWAELGE